MSPEEFFAEFGTLAEAPGSIKKIREMILDLALRGRLVAQDPRDVPAVLMPKNSSPKRTRLSAQLDQTPSSKPDELDGPYPYPIPKTWAWVTTSEVFPVITDGDHQPPPKSETGIPFLVIGNVCTGRLNFNQTRFVPEQYYASLAEIRIPRKGDLLYTVVGSYGVPVIVDTSRPFCVQRHIAILKASEVLDIRYAYYALQSPLVFQQATACATGTAQKTVPLNGLRRILIPLPPVHEQKRIVAKIEQLMVLCDELETKQTQKQEVGTRLTRSALDALTSAEGPEKIEVAWRRVADNFAHFFGKPESVSELRKAILELAVRGKLVAQAPKEEPAPILLTKITEEKSRLIALGTIKLGKAREEKGALEEPFSLPAGWAWSYIGEIFDVVGGIQKTPKRAPVTNHYPYLRVENVQRGRLDLSRLERFELVEGELGRWRLASGDLLIVEGNGSETEIGRCAVWNGEVDDCVHQNHLIRCRPIKPGESAFTLLFLNSPSGMAEMKELAITTSGLYSLSVGKIRGIMVPVPPLAEQKRIITKGGWRK